MKFHAIAAAIGLGLLASTANALTFNLTYEPSASNAPAGFATAFQHSIDFYQNTFSSPGTAELHVGWANLGSGVLAQTQTNFTIVDYAPVHAALLARHPSYVLPTNTVGGQIGITFTDAAALGLNYNSGAPANAGVITFNSAVDWSFASPSVASPNQYSLVGVAEHEISEAMGRFSTLPLNMQLQSVQDLFRYSAPGVLDTTGGNAYFSIDGGQTAINTFNGDRNLGDLGDWAIGSTTDSFNYAIGTNQAGPVSTGDITMMQALGYTTFTSAVPEPETYALLLAGLGLVGAAVKRRKSAQA